MPISPPALVSENFIPPIFCLVLVITYSIRQPLLYCHYIKYFCNTKATAGLGEIFLSSENFSYTVILGGGGMGGGSVPSDRI